MIHESGGPGNNTEDNKSLDKNTKRLRRLGHFADMVLPSAMAPRYSGNVGYVPKD